MTMTLKGLRAFEIVLIVGLGVLFWRGASSGLSAIQEPDLERATEEAIRADDGGVLTAGETPGPEAAATGGNIDEYERAALIWTHQRVAKSGWERGQEIFAVRCWTCHNEYARAADPSGAPSLRGAPKRLTDEAITKVVRAGGPGMAAYTRATLSDQDLADLLTYMRQKCGTFATGGGCFDEHNPPPNPRFRANWNASIP